MTRIDIKQVHRTNDSLVCEASSALDNQGFPREIVIAIDGKDRIFKVEKQDRNDGEIVGVRYKTKDEPTMSLLVIND